MEEKTSTIKEILNNIDLSKPNEGLYIDFIAEEIFDYYESIPSKYNNIVRSRLKSYHIMTWCCDSTWVGMEAFYLDGEFAFMVNRGYSSESREFKFASDEMFQKVKAFIKLFIPEKKDYYQIIDFDEQLGEMYFVHFASEIIHNYGFTLEGEIVDIVNKNFYHYGVNYKADDMHKIEIRKANGETEFMDCRNLNFKYNSPFHREDYEKQL